jgi:hypothetical protein
MQDGDIPLGQWARVRLHLLWCDACAGFERQLKFLRTALRNYRE